eukprot:49559-Hanusia_phi.AAC.1
MAGPLRAGPVSEARGRAPQLSLPPSAPSFIIKSGPGALSLSEGQVIQARRPSVVYHPCRSPASCHDRATLST